MLTRAALNLWYMDILIRDNMQNRIIIDVDKLLNMTDAEMLSHRNFGPVKVKRINEAREELKKLLINANQELKIASDSCFKSL